MGWDGNINKKATVDFIRNTLYDIARDNCDIVNRYFNIA